MNTDPPLIDPRILRGILWGLIWILMTYRINFMIDHPAVELVYYLVSEKFIVNFLGWNLGEREILRLRLVYWSCICLWFFPNWWGR